MEMGAYGGERDEFKLQGGKNAKKKNPPKFWERQDVIDLNELMVNETLVIIVNNILLEEEEEEEEEAEEGCWNFCFFYIVW